MCRTAAGAVLLLLAATPFAVSFAATADDLGALRKECIAAARSTQQHEQAVTELRQKIDLLGRDAAARRRGLDDSRREQARLLGVLEFLARNPPDRVAAAAPPIDRLRGELLLAAAVPALRAQAAALSREIARAMAFKGRVAGGQSELAAANTALATDRGRLAELSGQRRQLTRELLPADSGAASRIARLGREAKDSAELIKRTDAEIERRDKEIVARARAALPKEAAAMVTADNADPTRPAELRIFDPPQSALMLPVSGPIDRPFGVADSVGSAKSGVSLAAPAGGQVVAPFDGRVIYAGGLRDLGLVLIIRHGGGYHSLLAGLGRVDVDTDQWVLAGEPVGAMPAPGPSPQAGDAGGAVSLSQLYYELRRDGRPVDPQPWLAKSDDGHPAEPAREPDERNGDQRVRQ